MTNLKEVVNTIKELIQKAWEENNKSSGHQVFIAERRNDLRDARKLIDGL